jgi:hypothetical protein
MAANMQNTHSFKPLILGARAGPAGHYPKYKTHNWREIIGLI